MRRNNCQARSRSGAAASVQLLAVVVSAVVCLLTGLEIARFEPTAATAPPASAVSDNSDPTADQSQDSEPGFSTERLRGRVVWLGAALKESFGISTVPEVAENALALQTTDGQLLPLVENLRGRAFRKDERLRNKDLELLVRQYDRQPYLQILRVYEIDDGQLYELDYWCDVCAIVMFETGPCACCQDDNRLRRRLVKADSPD